MKVELFKDAIAIIDGIPESRIQLNSFQSSGRIAHESSEIRCGTLACAAGWLALHPGMRALGLHTVFLGFPAYRTYEPGYESLAGFFEITEREANLVFGPRLQPKMSRREIEAMIHLSDKELWLGRAHKLLKKIKNGKNKTE